MGRRARKKRRTQARATGDEPEFQVPRSMVIKRGEVSQSLGKLVGEFRELMMPFTAKRLQERKSNQMKDFLSVAPSLRVSCILAFTQSASGATTTLRFMRVPHGPTLTYRVVSYSLGSQVRKRARRAFTPTPLDFQHAPILVLNNFKKTVSKFELPDSDSDQPVRSRKALRRALEKEEDEGLDVMGKVLDASTGRGKNAVRVPLDQQNPPQEGHLKLVASMWQNAFPTIDVRTVRLQACRRVMLMNHNPKEGTFDLRHYLVTAAPVGMSKGIRKVIQGKKLDLSRYDDVADYVLNPDGGASDSEREDVGLNNRVKMPGDFKGKGVTANREAAVRLREIGPRMRLELVKIESGCDGGRVLYHRRVRKSSDEIAKLLQSVETKRKLKEARRKEQEANVRAKEEKKELQRKQNAEFLEKMRAHRDQLAGKTTEGEDAPLTVGSKRPRDGGDQNEGDSSDSD